MAFALVSLTSSRLKPILKTFYKLINYKHLKTIPSFSASDKMPKLFYFFLGYVALGFVSFSAISQSLETSTKLHCANGIQNACAYLDSRGIK